MKQFSLLIAFFCLLAGTSRALTISGTVIDATTSAPIGSAKVYVFDSLTSWNDSTVTNSTTGTYSFTIPTSAAISGNFYYVNTRQCGKYTSTMSPYTGSNITGLNLSVNCGSSAFMIHGTVSLNGIANSGQARVWLIHKYYSSSLADTVLAVVDSFLTAGTGGTYAKTYSSNPLVLYPGALLLKAALVPAHPQYWNFVPTYYTSSLVWSGASALTAANFNSANVTNINMISGTNPGGSGFIGGQVLLGANKNAAVGDPLPSRIIILTNSTGTPLRYTYSDAGGKYSFSNLAMGTYKLFGDAWSKTNPAYTLTLTTTKPTVTDLTFEETSEKFFAHFGGLGITSSALSNVAVYPNPVTDRLRVSGLSKISGDKSVILTDITGSTLQRHTFTNGQEVELSTSTLPAGVYMLQLQTEEGTASFRVIK
jgi:hypothetical protein